MDTIQYYNEHAQDFAAGTENADMSECRQQFLKYLKPGSRILDAGCGSGRDVLAFQKAGFEVDAFDASVELCKITFQKTGIPVKQIKFEDLEKEFPAKSGLYDGIWACASLLHVSKEDLPRVMTSLHRLLKPEGILYASFKYGTEERVHEGRRFTDMTEITCRELFEQAGFTVKETYVSQDVREGRSGERWINVIGKS